MQNDTENCMQINQDLKFYNFVLVIFHFIYKFAGIVENVCAYGVLDD